MYRRHLVVNIIIPFGLNIFRLLITHIPICVSCTAVNSTHCSQPLPPPHPINIQIINTMQISNTIKTPSVISIPTSAERSSLVRSLYG